MKINRITLAFITSLALTTGLSAPALAATSSPQSSGGSSTAGLLVAEDTESHITAKPTGPGEITVTTSARTKVTLFPAGQSRSKGAPINQTTNTKGVTTFTGLTAGVTYMLLTSTASTKVTALGSAGAATNVRVTTTDRPGVVILTWKAAKKSAGGSVRYFVEAIPAKGSPAASERITDEVGTSTATLRGLDTSIRYTFRVTPMNALGEGRGTSATMNRTLAEITSLTVNNVELETEGPTEEPQEVAPAPEVAPRPASAPAPAPAPAPSGPRTRTIYVCPDGFGDSGDQCTQSRGYTYHSETQTAGYTYHSESRVESCAGPDCPGSRYIDFGTDWTGAGCPNGGTLHGGQCMGWTGSTRTVSVQVKDAAPAGWSDDGSQYTRTTEVKDAAPAGFSDNGSEYVKTTSKVAREVAA